VAIRRHRRFFEDLDEAYAYIFAQSPTSAERLFEGVERVTGLLDSFPQLGRRRYDLSGDVRSFRVSGFPYAIYYRRVGTDIVLLRLLHGARNLRAQSFPD
jgi:plasmid stabilization system protein ParE